MTGSSSIISSSLIVGVAHEETLTDLQEVTEGVATEVGGGGEEER